MVDFARVRSRRFRYDPDPDFIGAYRVYDDDGAQLGTLIPHPADPNIYKVFFMNGFVESIGYCRQARQGARLLDTYRDALRVSGGPRDIRPAPADSFFETRLEARLWAEFLRESGRAGYLHDRLTEDEPKGDGR